MKKEYIIGGLLGVVLCGVLAYAVMNFIGIEGSETAGQLASSPRPCWWRARWQVPSAYRSTRQKLAADLDAAIRFPANVVFYALDSSGETALHRAGELIFSFPSAQGSPTLTRAVETMLAAEDGVVHYEYGGSLKAAVFARGRLTRWVFVLGVAEAPK